MSFTTRAITVAKHVLVLHEGVLKTQEMNEARTKAIDILEAHKWKKMLVDLRKAKIGANGLELFYFSSTHHEKFPLGMKIAVVANPQDHDKTSFADTVSSNRGVRMQTFHDWDQAMEWLGTR